ncbi:MAG TPA: AAA-like domain-containing protein, partial [Armatimonadota bacterium]|nr:AAA-like domain-containing protein [Armatimonadota bacterium]
MNPGPVVSPGPVSIDDRKPGFQSGGTLRSGSIYVERPADVELVEALDAGEFCYVLAPRQIGKSSLRARAAERLEARGVRCAAIDLNRIGSSDLTPDQWYASLGHTLARQLHLSKDPSAPASSILDRSPVERWFAFLRDPLLSEIKGRVVLFIDEIDSVRSLPFETDDFFAFIRAIHNARPDDPAFERLTVCLIGVATPGDLIRDPDKTPFNIGRGIRLEDFTPDEAEALLPGLEDLGDSPRALLRAVLDWTDGHPYMTQRVCDELARAGPSDRGAVERVAEVIERVFLTGGRTEDASLADADRRFSARG